MAKASEKLDQARKLMREGKYPSAVEQAHLSFKMAGRAQELCTGDQAGNNGAFRGFDRVERQVNRISALMDGIETRVNASGNAEAKELMTKALASAQQAKTALQEQKIAQAEREIITAKTWAYKALAIVKNAQKNENIEKELEIDGENK